MVDIKADLFGDSDDLETSALFAYLNTSKKGITLNLDVPSQAQSLKELAQDVDILVESFAPGYLESVGLSYEDLSGTNPGLIYVSVTPFGQSGPYRDYKGSDIVAQATASNDIGVCHLHTRRLAATLPAGVQQPYCLLRRQASIQQLREQLD